MIIGIDLGTTNSLAAVYQDGVPVVITSRVGKKQIPSIVSVDENGIFYAGDVAKERMAVHPEQTASAFKRSMGTQEMFRLGDKELKAEELSAVVLRNIKEDAWHFLGEKVEEAVISVPAFFSNAQRKAVLRAGELAGLKVRQIINEPTAAAMAYTIQNIENIEETADDSKILMVLDLGGGTFDISVMEVSGSIIEVVNVCGNNCLGGEDFTRKLMDLFLEANGIRQELCSEEENALYRQAEKAKKMISAEGIGKMDLSIGGASYTYEIREDEYEEACFELLEQVRKLSLQAVKESGHKPEDIGEILMVGGGMRLSIIRKLIEKMLGKEFTYQVRPDEAVALGAALQGCMLERDQMVKDVIMTDICPYEIYCTVHHSSGYDDYQKKDILIPKNTTIPAKRKRTLTTAQMGQKVKIDIFQSTGQYLDKEVPLGEMRVVIPYTDSGRAHVEQTVIYDVNGIVKLDVYIRESNYRTELILRNDNCELTMEEAKKRMEELDYLKASPLEEEENKLVYARAERLYAEYIGKEREMISSYLASFEAAAKTYDEDKVSAARERLVALMDRLEGQWFGEGW